MLTPTRLEEVAAWMRRNDMHSVTAVRFDGIHVSVGDLRRLAPDMVGVHVAAAVRDEQLELGGYELPRRRQRRIRDLGQVGGLALALLVLWRERRARGCGRSGSEEWW